MPGYCLCRNHEEEKPEYPLISAKKLERPCPTGKKQMPAPSSNYRARSQSNLVGHVINTDDLSSLTSTVCSLSESASALNNENDFAAEEGQGKETESSTKSLPNSVLAALGKWKKLSKKAKEIFRKNSDDESSNANTVDGTGMDSPTEDDKCFSQRYFELEQGGSQVPGSPSLDRTTPGNTVFSVPASEIMTRVSSANNSPRASLDRRSVRSVLSMINLGNDSASLRSLEADSTTSIPITRGFSYEQATEGSTPVIGSSDGNSRILTDHSASTSPQGISSPRPQPSRKGSLSDLWRRKSLNPQAETRTGDEDEAGNEVGEKESRNKDDVDPLSSLDFRCRGTDWKERGLVDHKQWDGPHDEPEPESQPSDPRIDHRRPEYGAVPPIPSSYSRKPSVVSLGEE